MIRRTAARLVLPLGLYLAGALAPVGPCMAGEPASWPVANAAVAVPAPVEPHLYVLAFSGAAIDDVAAAVLGAALGQPFDFDPALQGRMDLHVEERLTPDQLTERFSQALVAAGGAMVRQDGRLILMPIAKARRMARDERRARGVADRFAQEAASPAIASSPRFEFWAHARPGSQPVASLHWSPIWLLLAALAGAGTTLAGVLVWSRVSVGRFQGPVGRREAVIDYLLAREAIAPDALADARRRADEICLPLEQMLNQMGRVSDEALVGAYAAVTGYPIWRPADLPALTGPGAFGPTPDYLRLHGLAPVALEARRLTLAALDPLDDEGIAAVAAAADRPVCILVGAPGDVRDALGTN